MEHHKKKKRNLDHIDEQSIGMKMLRIGIKHIVSAINGQIPHKMCSQKETEDEAGTSHNLFFPNG
jgi:hypothetical protein